MSTQNFETFIVKTSKKIQFVDITREIAEYLTDIRAQGGIILIYTPHTTAGITINENADPAVTADIESFISQKIPQESYFRHSEGNSASHIMSSYFTASETLIVDNGKLVLGTWQGIFFCEFDGPRNRKVHLKFIADK